MDYVRAREDKKGLVSKSRTLAQAGPARRMAKAYLLCGKQVSPLAGPVDSLWPCYLLFSPAGSAAPAALAASSLLDSIQGAGETLADCNDWQLLSRVNSLSPHFPLENLQRELLGLEVRNSGLHYKACVCYN